MKIKNHILKADPEYFRKCKSREKTYECRFNDRNFVQGDTVTIQEFNRNTQEYSGSFIVFEVGYVLKEFPGLVEGYVIFSLLEL